MMLVTCCSRKWLTAAVVISSALLVCNVHAFDWSLGLGGSTPHEGQQHATDELTDETFDKYMKEHTVTAILFYAPWCFYSQQVMPAWDLAGQKLKIHDPPVTLAKIDAHRYGSVGDKYGVSAFPTMKLFVDGTVFEYDSSQGRGWQQIVKWVNRHLDRDHILKSVEDVDHYLNDNDLNVIGLFDVDRNNSIFSQSARHFEDISFAECRNAAVSKDIASHIAKHATLVCETIFVGQSRNNTKEVALPRKDMTCSDTPRNPQRPEWTDKYHASVAHSTVLEVKRLDKNEGWQQNLQIRCCDTETEDHKTKAHDIPVPSVVMFMPHDERFAKYDGDLEDIHALDKWISARRAPMVMRLSSETADKILDSSGPDKAPVLFFISNTPRPDIEKELREAAKSLRGRVLVTLSGTSSPIEKRLADLAGVDEDQLPVVTLVEAHGGGQNYHSSKKYRLPVDNLKTQDVINFVTDFEKGKLTPYLKSEPVPSKEDQLGPVLVLVGFNFHEVSQDPDTDVLIDFYAPWCGHCRKFEPNYKALAKKLQHVKTLKIYKLDATRNEVQGMNIMGFPTIVLFQAGSSPKRQVMYQGNRQPDDMVGWLKHHCHHKFDDRPPSTPAPKEPESGLLDENEEADL